MRAGPKGLLAATAALALAGSAHGSFPGRPGKLAFDSQNHICGGASCGRSHIYSVNPDGSGRKQLTVQRDTRSPAWSPNGKTIAFSTVVGPFFLMGANGRHVRRVGNGYGPVFSPDGSRIAYRAKGGFTLYSVRTDGKDKRRIVGNGDQPDWSPNGKTIVFQRRLDLYAVGATGGHVRRLTHIADAFTPSWSPDVKRIAFFRGGKDAIVIVGASGGRIRTVAEKAWPAKPAWSPDGERIAYVTGDGDHGKARLVTVRLDGTGRRTVVRNLGRPDGISWQRR